MALDRAWIEQHIPHKGRMCLLDEVLSWDAVRICCRSATHRSADNPLRAHGRLGAACGIEYAAQAMAVHGALIGASAPLGRTVAVNVRRSIGAHVGYLASVRNVRLLASRLDDLLGDLVASAERVTGDARTVLYEFSVWGAPGPQIERLAGAHVPSGHGEARIYGWGDRRLLSGRASIVFDTAFEASPGSAGAGTERA